MVATSREGTWNVGRVQEMVGMCAVVVEAERGEAGRKAFV